MGKEVRPSVCGWRASTDATDDEYPLHITATMPYPPDIEYPPNIVSFDLTKCLLISLTRTTASERAF